MARPAHHGTWPRVRVAFRSAKSHPTTSCLHSLAFAWCFVSGEPWLNLGTPYASRIGSKPSVDLWPSRQQPHLLTRAPSRTPVPNPHLTFRGVEPRDACLSRAGRRLCEGLAGSAPLSREKAIFSCSSCWWQAVCSLRLWQQTAALAIGQLCDCTFHSAISAGRRRTRVRVYLFFRLISALNASRLGNA